MSDLYDDPGLYDAQYRRYRDDLGFYRRLAIDCGGPVLELGCGSGRVTLELARSGVDVVGVDLSPAMLEAARQRAREAGLAARATFLEGDMRSFDHAERFALVLAPFNALMHAPTLEDQDATLATAKRHLVAGGAFAADCFVPDFGRMDVLRHEAAWDDVGGARADLYLVQHHDPVAQRIESRYLLDSVGDDGAVRRQRRHLVQRYFHRFELERLVRQAGFERVQTFGDFDRRPVREDSSVYVVVAS